MSLEKGYQGLGKRPPTVSQSLTVTQFPLNLLDQIWLKLTRPTLLTCNLDQCWLKYRPNLVM